MEEWDYARNTVNPWEIGVHSNLLVHWKCCNGHHWAATPNNREKTGCPYCNAHKLCPGENSLDVIDPILSKQWSPKNLPKTPRDVTAYCNDIYYWICPEGHEWPATVSNRHLGEGCPYCTHRKPIKGETDLQTCFPFIASQFLPELNNGKHPDEYLLYSKEKITWRCNQKHTWPASFYCRTIYGSGCPICLKLRKTNRKTI